LRWTEITRYTHRILVHPPRDHPKLLGEFLSRFGIEIEKLRGRYDKTHTFTDPIHSQLFYLDSKARKELAEKSAS
jgi:hypothetical protein